MAVLNHPPEEEHQPGEDSPSRGRLGIIGAAAAVLLVVVLAAWWLTRPAPAPVEEAPAGPAVETPAPREAPAPPPEPPAPEAPRETRARPRPAPKPAAPEEPPPAVPEVAGPELRVETDVEGALVFLDREFLGNAPVTTKTVTPGRHQVNVSAEGYDGVAQSVEIAESGTTAVTIRLKEVRLNEAVDVVHKHGMGSCQGRLTATLAGFRYVPQKGNDGFTLSLDAVDSFEIDYLKKNLRLRQKGGKTWNFESPTGSADPLFVFHRDVEKARAKLSATR